MPNRRYFGILFCVCLLPAFLAAQQNNIEKIEILGNSVVDSETYKFHLTQKAGDPYDRDAALADFQRLWATGFLDDLKLDVTDGERGKIVSYSVVERPRVEALDFVGSKELSANDIAENSSRKMPRFPSPLSTIPRRS